MTDKDYMTRETEAMIEWHHGYTAGVILRVVARAFEEEAVRWRTQLPDFPEFTMIAEWFLATSRLVERRARNLAPDAYDTVSDICRGLLESGRTLNGTPLGSNRLDYLLVYLANQRSHWIEPLKRRKNWLEPPTDQKE